MGDGAVSVDVVTVVVVVFAPDVSLAPVVPLVPLDAVVLSLVTSVIVVVAVFDPVELAAELVLAVPVTVVLPDVVIDPVLAVVLVADGGTRVLLVDTPDVVSPTYVPLLLVALVVLAVPDTVGVGDEAPAFEVV